MIKEHTSGLKQEIENRKFYRAAEKCNQCVFKMAGIRMVPGNNYPCKNCTPDDMNGFDRKPNDCCESIANNKSILIKSFRQYTILSNYCPICGSFLGENRWTAEDKESFKNEIKISYQDENGEFKPVDGLDNILKKIYHSNTPLSSNQPDSICPVCDRKADDIVISTSNMGITRKSCGKCRDKYGTTSMGDSDMREIKFRAWDEGNKVMHCNFQFIKSGDDGNDWIVFVSDKQKLDNKPHPFENPYFSQQLKIMQYTGLKDCRGVELFEYDIVKLWCDSTSYKLGDCFKIWITTVEYDQSSASFVLRFSGLNPKQNDLLWGFNETDYNGIPFKHKVIGNIYENPELLKECAK